MDGVTVVILIVIVMVIMEDGRILIMITGDIVWLILGHYENSNKGCHKIEAVRRDEMR
jgi:hypothetical protein